MISYLSVVCRYVCVQSSVDMIYSWLNILKEKGYKIILLSESHLGCPLIDWLVISLIQLPLSNFIDLHCRSMDGGLEEDEYTSDPIAQQTRQVC